MQWNVVFATSIPTVTRQSGRKCALFGATWCHVSTTEATIKAHHFICQRFRARSSACKPTKEKQISVILEWKENMRKNTSFNHTETSLSLIRMVSINLKETSSIPKCHQREKYVFFLAARAHTRSK